MVLVQIYGLMLSMSMRIVEVQVEGQVGRMFPTLLHKPRHGPLCEAASITSGGGDENGVWSRMTSRRGTGFKPRRVHDKALSPVNVQRRAALSVTVKCA